MEPPPAEVLSVMIADQLYQDDVSGRVSLLGIRSDIRAKALPHVHPQLVVYFVLTNGRGTVSVTLRLIDEGEEREPIQETQRQITFRDPLIEVTRAIRFNNLAFAEPGDYRVQLLVGGALVRERRLKVYYPDAAGPEGEG